MNQVLKQVIGKIGDLDYCLIGSGNLKYQGIAIEPDDLDFLIDEAGILEKNRGELVHIAHGCITTKKDTKKEKRLLVLEKELPQEKRGSLEYIDLRFNKVYYK